MYLCFRSTPGPVVPDQTVVQPINDNEGDKPEETPKEDEVRIAEVSKS
jgi:hypothetical protein